MKSENNGTELYEEALAEMSRDDSDIEHVLDLLNKSLAKVRCWRVEIITLPYLDEKSTNAPEHATGRLGVIHTNHGILCYPIGGATTMGLVPRSL